MRGHWDIEDRLHWVRDVTYDQDASQVRTDSGPRVDDQSTPPAAGGVCRRLVFPPSEVNPGFVCRSYRSAAPLFRQRLL
jgi:hypothetical protein